MTSENQNIDFLFETAVFVVQNLPKDGPVVTTNDEKLNFYGLFKQATQGDINVPKPSFYHIEGVYKWNSWKKLEHMTQEEAKNKYVDDIIDKMKRVQDECKTEEWMQGETYELLAPKFEILGILGKRTEPKSTSQESSESSEVVVDKSDVAEESLDHDATISALSDAEYADALDDEPESRSSSFTESRPLRRQNSPSLRSTCHRLEKELKVITESIDKLGKAVEERHNLLITLMKKATVYILVPRAKSWKTIIFFVFWPFVAHFLLRWLRRFFLMF